MANKEKKVPFKDLSFEQQISYLDDKISKTNKRIDTMSKSLAKAKKDIINLENQKKAIKWDKDHPEEKKDKKKEN